MSTVVISLLQKYTREERLNNKGYSTEQYIQLRLYKILNEEDADIAKKTGKYLYANQLERCGTTGAYINTREVTKRFRVSSGNYLIIPNCYDEGISGEFLLRVYTETNVDQSNCSELYIQKDIMIEEDMIFPKTNYLEPLFKTWKNYFPTNNQLKIKERWDTSKKESVKILSDVELEKRYVASTRLYINDAFINIYNKIDINRAKRLKTLLLKY